ncbi:MAG: hypothetical protein OXG15_06020 [Gammaproteobacteria bacterium]|nr:hypothetical protein [Gammaproteobacteria bacterium]
MELREKLISACAQGCLLKEIADIGYSDQDDSAKILAELHNEGDLHLLTVFADDQLRELSNHAFFCIQQVFVKALPYVRCKCVEAITLCLSFYNRSREDLSSFTVSSALQKWFVKNIESVDEGLAIALTYDAAAFEITRCALLSGSTFDPDQFVRKAIKISRGPNENVCRAAISVLGRLAPAEKPLDRDVLERLQEAIQDSTVAANQIAAFTAVLDLLERLPDVDVTELQRLVIASCVDSGEALRLAIAEGLRDRPRLFIGTMIDVAFEVIGKTDRYDETTISVIDSILYQWHIEDDQKRVLALLSNLLGRAEDSVEVRSLSNFRHKLANSAGPILGWYVVSLLLTGNDRLSVAASEFLPFQEDREGLDIDLGSFGLTPPWIRFLVQKILGYCILKKEGAASLLLSCLRTLASDDTSDVEKLIVDFFLVNYPSAIEIFESKITRDDVAVDSVKRLRAGLDDYITGLSRHGVCAAFKPSERDRSLQRYRQLDLWRGVHDVAKKRSVLSSMVHQIPMLYGTSLVSHVYSSSADKPERKEVKLLTVEYKAEFPRLEVMDPVGFLYRQYQFKIERPPS